jgi:hypothetical protein
MRKVAFMVLGIPETTLLLMMVGAFAALMANAALRSDPAWVLALGLPLLFCAARSELPTSVVAWGCAIYAAAGILFLLTRVIRAIGLPVGFGLIVAAAAVGLSAGAADASSVVFGASSLHHPPLIGVRLEAMLRLVARN